MPEEDLKRKEEYDKSEREEEPDKLPRLSDGELNEVIDEEFGDIRRCVLGGVDA